jgi:hypothetical protein
MDEEYLGNWSSSDDEAVQSETYPEVDDEIEDSEIEVILPETEEGEAVEQMLMYLDNAYMDREPLVLYTMNTTTYQSEMANDWNLKVAYGEDQDDPNLCIQLLLHRNDDGDYNLTMEGLHCGSDGGEEQSWSIGGDEVREVLKIYYHTGWVYDCKMKTIYRS